MSTEAMRTPCNLGERWWHWLQPEHDQDRLRKDLILIIIGIDGVSDKIPSPAVCLNMKHPHLVHWPLVKDYGCRHGQGLIDEP